MLKTAGPEGKPSGPVRLFKSGSFYPEKGANRIPTGSLFN